MAEEAGMSVDREGFDKLMEEQRVRARKAREALGDLGWAGIEFGTEMPATEFVGYDRDERQGKVLAIVAEGELRDEVVAGAEAIVVLDQTPFYAEMGGQVADHGIITADAVSSGAGRAEEQGRQVPPLRHVDSGELKVGDTVTAAIDAERRKAICRAHSATHLLDAALKKVLGDHVHQAGSLVEPDRLRFDFTHFEAITPSSSPRSTAGQRRHPGGLPVVTEVLPIEEAKKQGRRGPLRREVR